jgi:ATP-dependent DNA helicase RecG
MCIASYAGEMFMDIHSKIGILKGIGPKTEQLFHKLGVYTLGDILLHYPRDYEWMPVVQTVAELYQKSIAVGEFVAVSGRIDTLPMVKKSKNMPITTTKIHAQGHILNLIWFHMPYLRNTLNQGEYFVFLGRLQKKGQQYTLDQPQVFTIEKYQQMQQCLWPCYALTAGVSKNLMSKTIRQVLNEIDLSNDYLTDEIRTRRSLLDYNVAINNIHFPQSAVALESARKRLVFDEFFQFIVSARKQKEQMERILNSFTFLPTPGSWADEIMEKLPYRLTKAQMRTLNEVRNNMRGTTIMQRLIQGDVGSGKTILAFLAMMDCSQSGYQSALMVPTEVLARQHYETFCELCAQFNKKVPVLLLTGSLTQKEKRRIYDRIALYANAMVIGTHALIQDRTLFDNLALVITDEQHRFGVKQREMLYRKGVQPHILVMSATPIPRTLAIILYGDLDISLIDEVPAKRLPIKNCVVGIEFRPKAYQFIRQEIEKGHQVYVVCPLVEESEGIEAENVVVYTQKLSQEIPSATIEYLHGKMKPSTKNQIMESFSMNAIQILVSTTVIEVGVNVPNATVMLIEDAQRFGLAQLHQLRGRVGRGSAQSYCIMINTSDSEKAQQRLDILNKSNDGFFIAAEDLKLRGPGDFFGIRQSGLLEFKLGDIYQDGELLKAASEEATSLLSEDPQLVQPKNYAINNKINQYMEICLETVNL